MFKAMFKKNALARAVASRAAAAALVGTVLAPIGLAHAGLADGKLVIATEGAFRPYNFTENGKLAGMEIDLINNLCERMKVQCEIVAQSFDGLIPGLNMGKFDVIIAAMTATPKRQEVIAFTRPYSESGQTFATLADSSVAKMPGDGKTVSLEDKENLPKEVATIEPFLKDKVVGVQVASINARLLREYFGKDVQLREYKSTDQHDLDLIAGRVDVVMASASYLSDVIKRPENANVRMVGPRFKHGMLGNGSAIGVRKSDTELRDRLNTALGEALADGTMKGLSMKWIGIDTTPSTPPGK